MLKLLLLFSTILIGSRNAKDERINPNKATFDELISIPVINEGTALLIISLRKTKPFENIYDLVERTGLNIDSEILEKYVTFDAYPRKNFSVSLELKKDFFKLSSKYDKLGIHLKSQNKAPDQGFLKYKQVSAGNFGLLWDGFHFVPCLSVGKFNFFIEKPIEVAIGKNILAAAGNLKIKSHKISLGSMLEKDAKTLIFLGSLIDLKPITINLKFYYPDKKFSHTFSFSRSSERIQWQLNIRNKTVYARYHYTKTIPGIKSTFMLSGDGVRNYMALSREWVKGIYTIIGIKVTPQSIGIHELRMGDKFLGISYFTGNNERIGTSICLNPLVIHLSLSPEGKNFSICSTFNFKIRQNPIKAGINYKRSYLKLYFAYNA